VVVVSTTRQWFSLATTRIDPDPQPRESPAPPSGLRWPKRSQLRCPHIIPPPPASFASVLEARRSNRTLRPAPIREIVNALAFATRPRFVLDGDCYLRSRRPTPSAGAIHPIEIVIADWRGSDRLMRYNALDHSIEILRITHPEKVREFADLCANLLPDAHGTALVLIADQHRTQSLYNNFSSLIWRDAGALLEVLALVATAYRLRFCPLGILGGHVVDALALCLEQAIGVGCAIIGR
jgi:hypothetical protein